jgi:dienelactone hydrolase
MFATVRRSRPIPNAPLLAILILLLGPFPGVAAAAARDQRDLTLPEPNGRHPVGTTALVVTDLRRHRDLVLTMWYPAAAQAAAHAPYMDDMTADALAKEWKLEPNFQRRVHTHAVMRATLDPGGPFPIVLLEHGSSAVPALYTILAEGLASSGFIVIATNHPPDSLISVFPDGHVLRFAPYWPENADRRSQGIAIGRFATEVLAADVRFVLDELLRMNASDQIWRGHLDPVRVGIVGHSMGGTTAAVALATDARIVAGINLDGSTYPGMNEDVRPIPLRKPFMFIATADHAAGETKAREFVGKKGDTYYVTMAGADHMSFTDASLLSSKFGPHSKRSDAAFQRGVLLSTHTRTLTEEFFAKYLRGEDAPDLDATATVDKE